MIPRILIITQWLQDAPYFGGKLLIDKVDKTAPDAALRFCTKGNS
jgi:hypothetical protein